MAAKTITIDMIAYERLNSVRSRHLRILALQLIRYQKH
jgi:hypothetical protein